MPKITTYTQTYSHDKAGDYLPPKEPNHEPVFIYNTVFNLLQIEIVQISFSEDLLWVSNFCLNMISIS